MSDPRAIKPARYPRQFCSGAPTSKVPASSSSDRSRKSRPATTGKRPGSLRSGDRAWRLLPSRACHRSAPPRKPASRARLYRSTPDSSPPAGAQRCLGSDFPTAKVTEPAYRIAPQRRIPGAVPRTELPAGVPHLRVRFLHRLGCYQQVNRLVKLAVMGKWGSQTSTTW